MSDLDYSDFVERLREMLIDLSFAAIDLESAEIWEHEGARREIPLRVQNIRRFMELPTIGTPGEYYKIAQLILHSVDEMEKLSRMSTEQVRFHGFARQESEYLIGWTNSIPLVVPEPLPSPALSENDIAILSEMLAIGADENSPITRSALLKRLGWTTEGKRAMDKIKKFGYVQPVGKLGFYITEPGKKRAKTLG